MKERIVLKVNGKTHNVNVDPNTPLLYVLRNELELNAPKYGCGQQQCGACMALIDGKAKPTCMLPVKRAASFNIVTLEGIADKNGKLHPLQQAFIDEQAAQCGYCVNGMLIGAISLLNEKPNPTDGEIAKSMQISLCRCGSQARAVRAIKKVSGRLT